MKALKLILLVSAVSLLSGCAMFRGKTDKEMEQFKQLQFVYGGVNASLAVLDTSVEGYKVVSAKRSGNNIVFSGEGKMWGNAYSSPNARNYIFFEEDGKWYGGFWEWGSLGREKRALDNVNGRYRGWDPDRFNKATKYAFMITDKNATKRSNVVTFSK